MPLYPALFGAAGTGHAEGLVPDPGATAHPTQQWALLDTVAFAAIKGQILSSIYTATDESTTSTSYTDLSTADSVTFTLDATQDVLVLYFAVIYNSGANVNYSQVYLDGAAQTSPASELAQRCVYIAANAAPIAATAHVLTYKISGVTAGSRTVKIQHKVDAGTGDWKIRSLVCLLAG